MITRQAFPTVLKFDGGGIGARQVAAIVSTQTTDRMGDIIVQAGISLDNFRRSPTVLWQHDADHPIARAVDIGLSGGKLHALVQFPDAGVSAKSDETYGLIKAGVINSTSIGFQPLEAEPIDPQKPYGGRRFLKSELIEFSFVSAAANPQAVITARSFSELGRLKTMLAERRAQHEREVRKLRERDERAKRWTIESARAHVERRK
jgi:HK97 family phage prohead protease